MPETLFHVDQFQRKMKWIAPGDVIRKPGSRMKRNASTPARKREQKQVWKHNPFRQPIADTWETEFRHMHWQGQRDLVRSSMVKVHTSTTALDRFDNCGAECVVEWSDTAQRYRLRASYCHCRHCRPCMKAKGNLIAINLKTKLEAGVKQEGDRFRFITLTLRHNQKPLKEQIAALQSHFRILRGSKLWKESQRGGAAMIEVALNDRKEWHPHLHIIAEGDFIKQDKLANEWMRITKDSFKVDVRAIKTTKDAAFYVAKYVAKGTVDEVWQDTDRAQEWLKATAGLRTCATYGTWRGFKLTQHHATEDLKDWKPVALLTRIVASAADGSIADLRLLDILATSLQYNPSKPRAPRTPPAG